MNVELVTCYCQKTGQLFRSLNVSDLSFSQLSSSLEHLGNSSLDIYIFFYISVNTMNVTLSGFITVTHRTECLCFFQRLKCESSNIWCLNLHITGSSPTPDWECFQTSPRSTRRPPTFFCRSTQYTPMCICVYIYIYIYIYTNTRWNKHPPSIIPTCIWAYSCMQNQFNYAQRK